ncbi:alanine/glycine:cation symporter family protein [Aeoliella mucimassa]|uniref:Amino-acid carrier protein AlsT n=1 Tax=Aeoliella mucimassa TaxID=2527972 RepID=A0A518AP50_9BACT|nr:alanine/glycine:cation symporter family protein [Aeoliella mucimassa]QDU56492.1 Amino-acid carrier protein AlsT [Aeoliella mucimassa]
MFLRKYAFWPFFLALFLLVVAATTSTTAWAQDAEPGTTAESADTDIAETSSEPTDSEDTPEEGWIRKLERQIDQFFGVLVSYMVAVLFYDFGTSNWLGTSVPFVVVWLAGGAIFLTFRMGFINLRAFGHAIRVTKGDYDDPDDPGEVTHFQALTSALSATVGLGNIAGVAIAVGTGGPGALFWMIAAGFFGMTSKFVECTLGQAYRKVEPDGHVSGGPMRYLDVGLSEMGLGALGKVLSIVFALLCIGASFGGGCAFQVNQSMNLVKSQLSIVDQYGWIYGLVMVVAVGIVIIGGIRRIAATAEKIVPLMCGVYVLASLAVLFQHYDRIPWAFQHIFSEAFELKSAFGGMLGVMVIGIKRSSFSNEAGVGSAAIAHSAAKTDHPIREGVVALLEPFIDTIVVCTMTGLVIIISGVYDAEQYPKAAEAIAANDGAGLTSMAFEQVISWFPYVLTVAVVLFAYSTMISWSYYGERCFTFLFGRKWSLAYRIAFLFAVLLGSVIKATNVLDFSDLMILSMAFPNMLGLFLLSGKVKRLLDDYWTTLKTGGFASEEHHGKPRGAN